MKYSHIITVLFFSSFSFAQDFNFKSEYNPGSNSMIENYFQFEGINYSQNTISGKNIVNKNYTINLKEYKDGKLLTTSCLAKSYNEDYAIIHSEKFNFSIFGKREDDIFTIQFFCDQYSNEKHKLILMPKHKEDYILKEIPIKENELKINKPFIFLILTTPQYFDDGHASWCEVAANETPDKIYEKNKIQHFFVFEMTIEE